MQITLCRKEFYEECTQGQMFIGDKFFAHVLEDKDRGLTDSMSLAEINIKKMYGVTAIPYGRYKVIVTYSNKFKRDMCLVLGVKGYVGIRIHGGQTHVHTLGCLLVAKNKFHKRIQGSMEAELTALVKSAIQSGEEVYLNITK